MKKIALQTSLGVLATAIVAMGLADNPVIGQANKAASRAEMPAPSFPVLPDPKSVEELMPYAREVVRNKSAFLGRGLGDVAPGETVLIITTTTKPEAQMYMDAVFAALKERGVNYVLMHDYELLGVTLEEARAVAKYIEENFDSPAKTGWTEGCRLGNSPLQNMKYLKETRPDLYDLCNPPAIMSKLPADLREVFRKLRAHLEVIPAFANDYMDKNPHIKGVFYGRGGPLWMSFHPHETRWMGPFTLDNRWDLVGPAASLPADVWMLSEELTMEPLASSDKVTVQDPEGTDVWWEMTEDQAQRWSKGVYLRGHLFMFPQEAYGQYALSVVNYPALDPVYIPVEDAVMLNGVISATASHYGFFPRITEVWENGYLKEVKGGGIYGDLLRTLMSQPGIHDVVYPQRKKPGYFYHFETALGTNPKIVRHELDRPGGIVEERARDGVIHWALGAIYWNDPGSMGGWSDQTGELKKFAEKTGFPAGHGFHLHTYFNTMKLRMRGTDKWVTVLDRGRSTSLDHPEVRALASRYGNPDKILATEWVPEIPGINAPGSYEEFAKDPYKYSSEVMAKVMKGEYNVYNPLVRKPN